MRHHVGSSLILHAVAIRQTVAAAINDNGRMHGHHKPALVRQPMGPKGPDGRSPEWIAQPQSRNQTGLWGYEK
jgi:hypothetical protein